MSLVLRAGSTKLDEENGGEVELQNISEEDHQQEHHELGYDEGDIPLMGGIGDASSAAETPSAVVIEESEEVQERRRKARRALCISYTLSCWGDRVWDFALPILFLYVYPDTLFYPALYEFATCVIAAIFTTRVGIFVDRASRLNAVRFCLITQNLSVACACVAMQILQYRHNAQCSAWEERGWLSALIAFGSFSKLASTGSKIAVGKDWAVIVAGPGNAAILADLNALLRRMDLTAAIVAPLLYGSILTAASKLSSQPLLIGLGVVGGWNLLSLPVEYNMLLRVYFSDPALAVKSSAKKKTAQDAMQDSSSSSSSFRKFINEIYAFFDGWRHFASHRVALASLALSMLYFTVLQPGVLMTTFLKTRGFDDVALGVFRGVSSAAGVGLTFLAPIFVKKWGVANSGLVFLWWQFSSLFIGTLFFLWGRNDDANSIWKLVVFLAFLVISRFGLYGFDLAEVQIMQSVEEEQRGTINAVEGTIIQIFSLAAYGAAIGVPDPENFAILVLMSIGCVFCAACLFSLWFARHRNDETKSQDENPA